MATHRQTVLIVDDEPLFLSSVAEGLRSSDADYDVMTAADGKEAIRLADTHGVDLVVTDLKMPELDGFELIRYLMENHPGTPVLVMTAFGTPDIEATVRVSGAIGYLEKPIDFEVLAERIEEGLHRSTRGHIQGITLFSFLQLLQMEKKTCTLEVRSRRRRALLHFQEGELIDAEAGGLRGEAAVQGLVGWDRPKIEIDNVCRAKERTIAVPLTNLLLEAARIEDEKARGAGKRAARTEAPDPAAKADGRKSKASTLQGSIDRVLQMDGVHGAALIDLETGACLASAGQDGAFDLELAAAAAEVVRAERSLGRKLGLERGIHEILVTLQDQIHVTRLSSRNRRLFLFLVLDREDSNLGLLRLGLEEIEEGLGL